MGTNIPIGYHEWPVISAQLDDPTNVRQWPKHHASPQTFFIQSAVDWHGADLFTTTTPDWVRDLVLAIVSYYDRHVFVAYTAPGSLDARRSYLLAPSTPVQVRKLREIIARQDGHEMDERDGLAWPPSNFRIRYVLDDWQYQHLMGEEQPTYLSAQRLLSYHTSPLLPKPGEEAAAQRYRHWLEVGGDSRLEAEVKRSEEHALREFDLARREEQAKRKRIEAQTQYTNKDKGEPK